MTEASPSDAGLALLARVARHASDRPDAPAYIVPCGESLTYRQLADRAFVLANELRSTISAGSVIILSCPNRLEFPIAFLAILAAGCTAFPVSPDAADVELKRAAAESGAVAIIADNGGMGGSPVFPTKNTGGPPVTPGLLLQSSGTTGLPKIVRRSGSSLDAVARAMTEAIDFRAADRVLMTVPLTHSYGLEHGLLAPIWAGSCVHLCRGLDLSVILPELSGGGITIFPGVPSTFEMIAAVADPSVTIPALRIAYSAGGALPRTVFDRFADRFGVRIGQLYGATEIGSVTYNVPGTDSDPGSVGRAMRDVSVRILGLDGLHAPVSSGKEGQVAIRAASMFDGYLNEPADLIDGYFPTGDLGNLDEAGRLFITGRIKLLIDVGGLKVNPLEVETILEQHPAVAVCIVVPVRQSETVFRLKAIISPRDASRPPSVDELRRLARSQLAAYKIPREFEIRDSLPRSATGKILRPSVEMT